MAKVRSYVHFIDDAVTVVANTPIWESSETAIGDTLITKGLGDRAFGRLLVEYILESTTDVAGIFRIIKDRGGDVVVRTATLPAVAAAASTDFTRYEIPIDPDAASYRVEVTVACVIRTIHVTEIVGDVQARMI